MNSPPRTNHPWYLNREESVRSHSSLSAKHQTIHRHGSRQHRRSEHVCSSCGTESDTTNTTTNTINTYRRPPKNPRWRNRRGWRLCRRPKTCPPRWKNESSSHWLCTLGSETYCPTSGEEWLPLSDCPPMHWPRWPRWCPCRSRPGR